MAILPCLLAKSLFLPLPFLHLEPVCGEDGDDTMREGTVRVRGVGKSQETFQATLHFKMTVHVNATSQMEHVFLTFWSTQLGYVLTRIYCALARLGVCMLM